MAALLVLADLVGVGLAVLALGAAGGWLRPAALVGYPLLAAAAHHRPRVRLCLRVTDELGRLTLAAGMPALVLAVFVPAPAAVWLALGGVTGLLAARGLAYGALRAARRRGQLVEAALIVGAGEMGVRLAEDLAAHPELGAVPVGFVDTVPSPEPLPLPVLGPTDELGRLVEATRASRVLVCYPVERDRDLVPLLRACRSHRVDICFVPRFSELGVAVPRSALDEVWGTPLLPLRRGLTAPAAGAVKRGVDVVVATVALLVAGPLLLALAGALRLRHGAPVLFRQTRLSTAGRRVRVVKLRTLPPQADPDTTWTGAPAPGGLPGFLRDRHLDELPQLWNVLRGDLSLVGPRPERPFFAARFAEEIEGYAGRTRAPAGLTGWAQVHGLHGDTSLVERARFDNAAIEWWTPLQDLVVLARTLAVAWRGATRPAPAPAVAAGAHRPPRLGGAEG